MVRRLEDGNIEVNGKVLTSVELSELVEFSEARDYEAEVKTELNERYGEGTAEALTESGLVESIVESYKHNRSNNDTWRDNLNDAFDNYTQDIVEEFAEKALAVRDIAPTEHAIHEVSKATQEYLATGDVENIAEAAEYAVNEYELSKEK
ncbi:MAG: hypothetical protein IJK26_09530 [Clostridia bacterium]|nr:hypothetical protein [Clostridia bacterium]